MTGINSKAIQTSCTIDKKRLAQFIDDVSKISEIVKLETKSIHEEARFQLQNYLMIVYKSGKVVYHVFSDFTPILRKYSSNFVEQLPDDIVNKDEQFFNYDLIIGQDEVGKGEMFGPMITGSVAIRPDQMIEFKKKGVRDSKTISSKTKIHELSQFIELNAVACSISRLYPKRFNELFKEMKSEDKNLNDLLAWQHANVLKSILDDLDKKGFNKARILLIIDEFDKFKTNQRIKTILRDNIEVIHSIKAEQLSVAVAAASIVAKDKRNEQISKIEEKYDIKLTNSTVYDLINHPDKEEFLKLSFIKK